MLHNVCYIQLVYLLIGSVYALIIVDIYGDRDSFASDLDRDK